jgi:hypothetical protein
MQRYSTGHQPQLTFTSDFHELVQGDLIPGPCVLRYDPLRLLQHAPLGASYDVRSHLRFHPDGGRWDGLSRVPSSAPLAMLADPSGQGWMLETTFRLPSGCDEIEAWFSTADPDGKVLWDSAFGRNYHLRFPAHDLAIERARTRATGQNPASDLLEITLSAVGAIDAVRVRWRVPKVSGNLRRENRLEPGERTGGRTRWTLATPVSVPSGAPVVFDLVYTVGGCEYTDDNEGRWYVAD